MAHWLMSTLCMTSSPDAHVVLLLSTLKTVRTPRRPKSVLMGWNLMVAGSELTSQSQNAPILPLLGSTWGVQPMVEVEVEVAAAAAAVVVGVHTDAPHGTMTGATTGAMIEVTIVTMIATMKETTDPTDADHHLLTTAEATVQGLARAPTLHVTTEIYKQRHGQTLCFCSDILSFFSKCVEMLNVFECKIKKHPYKEVYGSNTL